MSLSTHQASSPAGLSPFRLERIRAVMDRHIHANRLAGALGLIWRRGSVAYQEAFGMSDREASRTECFIEFADGIGGLRSLPGTNDRDALSPRCRSRSTFPGSV